MKYTIAHDWRGTRATALPGDVIGSEAQARRYGAKNMPGDLKRAGFQVCVFASDAEINGGIFYRVSYGR